MKILFSPSESKIRGGRGEFKLNSLIFSELGFREFAYEKYINFIANADESEVSKLFGLKKSDNLREIDFSTLKAILRYDGVAYKALKYRLLNKNAQNYIDDNVLIFSNLFGVLRANDEIPFYKLKQGEKIGEFDTSSFYSEKLKEPLTMYLGNDNILDLRAQFYNKFFIPQTPYLTLKFFKNGKIVSHTAKVFRGEILKLCAQNNVQNFSEFRRLEIENLRVKNISESANKICISFDII